MTDQTQSATITSNTLETSFKELYDELSSSSKQVRLLQENLKGLYKQFKSLDKLNRAKKKRPQPILSLSKPLEKFLSLEHGTKMTKAEVMKGISAYIKEKNLQVAENKRQFVPNKDLSKLFDMKKPYSMTFVEINKHVSHHLSK